MNKAFAPYQLGNITLANRIVMAPMTRNRATQPGNTPSDLTVEYYTQRASAGLIITEGIQPSVGGQGYPNTPGLHSAEQVAAWRKVTDAVHQAGGVIFAQLMHAGRIGHSDLLPAGLAPVGPSAIAAEGHVYTHNGPQELPVPKEMTADDIAEAIADFATAARNAMAAGFDGVELHGANGYLIHQFLAPSANQRSDEWGGSASGRNRFAVAVARAVSEEIGAERVGIRLSPGNPFNSITEEDLPATYLPLVNELSDLGLAYLHLLEAPGVRELALAMQAQWPTTFILNPFTSDGPTGPDALHLIDDNAADLIAYGVLFLANPDLPARLAAGGPFNSADPQTFYGGDERGYTDYPTLVSY